MSAGAPAEARSDNLYPRAAWLGAMAEASLNAGGMIFEVVLARQLPGEPVAAPVLSILVGVVSLLVLLLRRRRSEVRLPSLIYLLNLIAVVAALFATAPHYAMSTERWMPFQANKLGCLITALIAPSFPLGLFGILAHAGSSVVQYLTFPEELRAHIAFGEPVTTLAFGAAGFLTLTFRLSRLKLEQRVVTKMAEARAMRELARTLLSVRDLMNTPLQVIEIAADLLREGGDDKASAYAQLEGAMDRLRALNSTLAEHEALLAWDEGDTSFDAARVLAGRPPGTPPRPD